MMHPELHWYRIGFRLLGNLHVGFGRWGYVLPSRHYVPGWTLWGALTVMLKRKGVDDCYGRIGEEINKNFWLSHLFLCRGSRDCRSYWFPHLVENRITYAWQNADRIIAPPDQQKSPMVYRHGVVRGSTDEVDSQGRLFLSETVKNVQEPFRIEGYFGCRDEAHNDYFPEPGDRLSIGGNRQVSGAELIVREIIPLQENTPVPDELNHLLLDHTILTSGNLERIVLRRTRKKGEKRVAFGQHFVDWDDHLAPGWEMAGTAEYEPVIGDDGFRHGTIKIKEE